MFNFNVGAQRPAQADARVSRMAAANDLVARTLAQNGISTGHMPDMAVLGASKVPSRFAGMTNPPAPETPDGAEFRQDAFTCPAGSRAYHLYVPSTAAQGVTGLVMMLHGCTQTGPDFATGTGMNTLAEAHGFIVVYPQQSRGDNAQSCWNWFSRGDQRRDRGEPAILAGLAQAMVSKFGVPPGSTYVAGLSAGGAMAAILGEAYPDIFSAVGAHSGLPVGAAKDVPSAFAAMAGNGPGSNAPSTSPVRTIVFHGTADRTVHPSNGHEIAERALAGWGATIATTEQKRVGGRIVDKTLSSTTDGRSAAEHWRIEGLGHAWSGGQPGGSYVDAQGPDASAEMVRFFFEEQDQS